jgi:SNF2 family DNA or RNA helicase
VTTLTVINELLYNSLEIAKVLVIAPLRVAQEVWTGEIEKWDHLKHLKISLVLGSEVQRKKALLAKADIYVINCENVVWLTAFYGSHWPFDMHIFDESSKFKNPDSRRFKAIRKKQPFVKRTVILTGTPTPKGLMDLWSQMYLLDQGARLGETLTKYRDRYFRKKDNGFGWEIRKEDKNSLLGESIYEKEIYDKISDICISMKAVDYLELPKRINNIVKISLSDISMKKYLEFEKIAVLQLAENHEITAVNAGALTTKLLQYANGAVYDENKHWHEIHREKLEALEEIIEGSGGEPVLVAYSFISDLERIQAYFKAYKPRTLKTSQDFKDWNSGQINVGLIHPASGGHGLNLQYGGHIIVWFGKTYSLELEQQLPARLDRQGQTKPVIVHHLICRGTMDEDVMLSLQSKETVQNALMKAVKARLNKYLVHG